jgi:hypothetical protein
VTDPVYVEYTPRNLINQTAEMYERVDEISQLAMSKARDYNLDLVDINYSSQEDVKELLGEPLALPAAIIRKVGPGTMMDVPTGEVFLGIDFERKPIKEDVRAFALTVITGENTRQAAHVVMEGCVLNGIGGILFDSGGEFVRMDSPNRNASVLKEFDTELEPLSMPVRNFEPGTDVFVDLSSLNERLFADIAGVTDNKTISLIGSILSERKAKSLDDIAKKLGRITEEEDKYYAARGARICRLLDQCYPGLFNGPPEANELLAPWMKRIGRIARVNLRGLDSRVAKGVIYSVLSTVYEQLKGEASGEQVKVEVMLEGPDMAMGVYIDKEINAIIKLCTSAGVGVCVRASDENLVDSDLVMNATARITCMENNELSVRTQKKKPYRVHLRPTLSGS